MKELETGWAAQENATRQIIQSALSSFGPKINSFLALSGSIEMTGSRFRGFYGPTTDELTMSTVELDFDIKLSEWLTGSLVLNWERGTGAIFPTSQNVFASGVDRFTLDRTHMQIGNLMLFPIAVRAGRETLRFGSSTGVSRLDNLSIGTPLTQEVFENRQTAVGLEFAWPTPPLRPPPAPIVVPPVKPLVIAPFVSVFARWLGYIPPPYRYVRPVPVIPAEPLPPFYGSIQMYKGSELISPHRTLIQDFNASLGYRTTGHCGLAYEQLWSSLVCPWAIDVHVDYDSSVFDSKFLQAAYSPFAVGRVPGMAATAKTRFGPFLLIGEVNSAVNQTTFLDGTGTWKKITPLAWQVSAGYQFDWNPWVTEIGAQGDFIAVGYSATRDMAGGIDYITASGVSVLDLISGGGPIGLIPGLNRIGFVPEHRLLVTAGEWPLPELRVSVEYSANWDYPQSAGGTGVVAHGVFGQLRLDF